MCLVTPFLYIAWGCLLNKIFVMTTYKVSNSEHVVNCK